MATDRHNIGSERYGFYPKTEGKNIAGNRAKNMYIDGYIIDNTGVAKR